jgi:hypothetical protein
MAYLYRHIRLDKNEPFYIGIGSDSRLKRAFEQSRRNKYWYNITNKTDYEVDILIDDLTWEEACEKEKEFIELYGRRDINTGTLVNLTGGGDGAYKTVPSIETRNKLSLKAKGKIYKDSTKKLISNTLRELYKDSSNHPRSKKVICTKTGKIYNSIKEAAIDNLIEPKYLRRYLSGQHKNKTTLKYY